MRNVVVLFITQERLTAEIFIDTVRIFKGLKGSWTLKQISPSRGGFKFT